MIDLLQVRGKTAIITGASSGIGYSTAEIFAQAGINVVVAARRIDRLERLCRKLKKYKVKTLPVQLDVTNKDEINEMVRLAIKKFKRIDILVNNAGILEYGSVLGTTDESWQRTQDVNVRGYLWVAQAVACQMAKRKRGKIINVTSIAGEGAFSQIAAYNVSKAGITMLTKNMALEFGPLGISVNGLAPGMIATEMTQGMLADKKQVKGFLQEIPLGRVGTGEDMGKTALFLASDLSSYVTGATVIADGGWTCHL